MGKLHLQAYHHPVGHAEEAMPTDTTGTSRRPGSKREIGGASVALIRACDRTTGSEQVLPRHGETGGCTCVDGGCGARRRLHRGGGDVVQRHAESGEDDATTTTTTTTASTTSPAGCADATPRSLITRRSRLAVMSPTKVAASPATHPLDPAFPDEVRIWRWSGVLALPPLPVAGLATGRRKRRTQLTHARRCFPYAVDPRRVCSHPLMVPGKGH